MPKRYPIRALKSVLLFFILALLLLLIVYYTSADAERQVDSFWAFIQPNLSKMLLFLAFFGLAYPFIGYVSQKVACLRELSAGDKEAIVTLFSNARFVLVKDENGRMVFHHVSPAARISRMFEDTITVDYSAESIMVEGLRRDALRLARSIDWYLRKE